MNMSAYHGCYNNFYLRSSYEYVMIKILEKMDKYERIAMEEKTYELGDGRTYKPDFFLYNDGGLEKIIEVKAEHEEYYKTGKEKVDLLDKKLENIEIEILTAKDLISLSRKNGLSFYKLSSEWKGKEHVTNEIDVSGKNNPMYGKKQSEESKRKNGNKTTERFKNDPDFRERHSKAVKKAMKKVPKEKLAFKNRTKKKNMKCLICGIEFISYTTQAKYCKDCKEEYSGYMRTKIADGKEPIELN